MSLSLPAVRHSRTHVHRSAEISPALPLSIEKQNSDKTPAQKAEYAYAEHRYSANIPTAESCSPTQFEYGTDIYEQCGVAPGQTSNSERRASRISITPDAEYRQI